MEKIMIVSGMSCGHCVQRVKNALSQLEGVENVEVNLQEKKVVITTSIELDHALLTETVDDAGYDVIEIQ